MSIFNLQRPFAFFRANLIMQWNIFILPLEAKINKRSTEKKIKLYEFLRIQKIAKSFEVPFSAPPKIISRSLTVPKCGKKNHHKKMQTFLFSRSLAITISSPAEKFQIVSMPATKKKALLCFRFIVSSFLVLNFEVWDLY